jgi:hypothetical protein
MAGWASSALVYDLTGTLQGILDMVWNIILS